MAIAYNHRAIEEKWRRDWEEHPINVEGDKKKYYCLLSTISYSECQDLLTTIYS